MGFTAGFLLQAADYTPMFKVLLAVDPGAKGQVDNAIGWARMFLKKQDRIVWFLRWVRAALAADMPESGPELPSGTEMPVRQDVRAFRKALDADIRLLSGFTVRSLKQAMEHYLSLPIPEIQNHVFRGSESPQGLLWNDFAKLEERFNEERRGLIVPKPQDKAVLEFPDGWAWWLLPRAYDKDEAAAMGHCGNSPEAQNTKQQILSLREPRRVGAQTWWEPHATFIYNTNGYLGEMKGKQNNKPVPRLHPYILGLLKLPMVKGVVGGGYKPENNFKLSDFSPEMQQQLSEARPDLFAPSGDASVQEIITALQLEPDAWDEERKRFVVQKWETGIDFLSSMAGYDGQQIVDLYTGKSQPDPPTIYEIVEILADNSAKDKSVWSEDKIKTEKTPNYLQNFALELMYESFTAPPRDSAGDRLDLTDHGDVQRLVELVDDNKGRGIKDYFDWLNRTPSWRKRREEGDKEKARPKKEPALAGALKRAVQLYNITIPHQSDAQSEVESALDALMDGGQYGTEVDYNGDDDPAYQYLSLARARKYAEQVTKMGKGIPSWDRDVNLPLGGGDWWSSDSYGDYLMEQLDEEFGTAPAQPNSFSYEEGEAPEIPWKPPKEQRRFRFPRLKKTMSMEFKSPLLKIAPLTGRGEHLFEQYNNEVLEEVPIGDYELYLVRDNKFGFYQIGLQRAGMDMTDLEQQAQRIVPRDWGGFDRRAFKQAIQRWLDEHHLLVVGSHSAFKTRMYGLALRAIGFRLSTTATGHLSYLADEQADRQQVQNLEAMARYLEQHPGAVQGPQ
jgi:hypothetical protein